MNKLLTKILDAHGGLDRWNQFSKMECTIVTDGEFWGIKGLKQDQSRRQMTVSLKEEYSSVSPFGNPDWHTEFVPGRIAIVTSSGQVVSERNDPRASFAGHQMTTPWDSLHRAYFNGYALWTYLTTPFLLAMNDVEITEIEPWREDGETWRVLRAIFPQAIATHSPVQEFFFGDDFLLRRHDYKVDIAGGFEAAQHVSAYIEANGICLPSKRKAYTRRTDRRVNLGPLMVSIDISDVHFR
jgi:hypothetical protein